MKTTWNQLILDSYLNMVSKILGYSIIVFSIYLIFYHYNLFLGSLALFIGLYILGVYRLPESKIVIKNSNLAETIDDINKLIVTASDEIKIFSGSVNPQIFCNNNILEQIYRAKKDGVKIQIITTYNKMLERAHICKNYEILEIVANNGITLFDFEDDIYNYNHFIIVDDKNIRVENNHVETSKLITCPESYTIYETSKARILSKKFELIKGKCKIVENKKVKDDLKKIKGSKVIVELVEKHELIHK